MEKKRVCFVDYDMCDWGGIEQVIDNLSKAFKTHYMVSIISLCTGFKKEHEDIECITIINKRARMREIIVKGYTRLIRVINEKHIDVIVVCGMCAGFIITLIKPFIKAKVIFADHQAFSYEWENKAIRCMRYLSARCADCTVVLTEKSEQGYIERFGISKKKLVVICNWIDPGLLDVVRMPLVRGKKIITVGRLEKVKGYDRLLKVAKVVLPRHPDWEWHIFGEGGLKEQILEGIECLGLQKQLIIKGESQQLYEEYCDYAIFVLTSYYEGFVLALLEAKASHLPLVSFDIESGPSEMIVDGVNGFLVVDGDVDDMVVKLERLMCDEELRVSFSYHAHDDIIKFKKDSILIKWTELIDAIVS